MFSGLPCNIAHIAHIARNPGRVDVQSLACEIKHISTYSKEPGESEGSAGWRSVRAAFSWFCMVFFATCGTACFLHGFCNMWNSLFFAWFLQHVEQLVFLQHVEQLVFSACTVLHVCMSCGSTPWNSPLFSCQAARVRCRSWRTSVRNEIQLGTVPARHCACSARLIKCPLGTVPAQHI